MKIYFASIDPHCIYIYRQLYSFWDLTGSKIPFRKESFERILRLKKGKEKEEKGSKK